MKKKGKGCFYKSLNWSLMQKVIDCLSEILWNRKRTKHHVYYKDYAAVIITLNFPKMGKSKNSWSNTGQYQYMRSCWHFTTISFLFQWVQQRIIRGIEWGHFRSTLSWSFQVPILKEEKITPKSIISKIAKLWIFRAKNLH